MGIYKSTLVFTKIRLFCLLFIFYQYSYSQVGINTTNPDNSALLDIHSTNKGVLLPRVHLTSRTDISTITNPAKGLVIIADANAGTSINQVFENHIYVFNGSMWEELLEENRNAIDFLFPKLAALGRKTSITTCLDSQGIGLGFREFELDPNTIKNKDGNILNVNGSLKASRKGFYSWSIQLEQIMPKDAYAPYIIPGLYSYEFRRGVTTVSAPISQFTTFSGSIYLEKDEISSPFIWHLGGASNQKCSTYDRIGKQIVVWKYLGE